MAGQGIWWRIAWRNLWRNPRRTLITAGALAVGFFSAVVIVGISDGITREMVLNGTEVITGQIQIHSRGYRPERSIYETLGGREGVEVARLLTAVSEVPGVRGAAARVLGGGLVSSGAETVAVGLMGFDPELEPRVSRILTTVFDGRPPRRGAREILIGYETRRKLDVAPGDEVVLVAPAADGSMGNDLFVIAGVFRTGIYALDGHQALVPMGALQELMVLEPSRVHEVAVALVDAWAATRVAAELTTALTPMVDSIVAEPWTDFRAELQEYAALADAGNTIIVFIVFIMAIFGVANTLLMSTYERRREFAVVSALGTSRGSIARTVVFEGLVLGILGLTFGAVLTWPTMVWLHNDPIDLSRLVGDITMAGSLVRPVITVDYSVDGPVISAVALFVTSLVAAVFPAYRAVRIPPADALAGR